MGMGVSGSVLSILARNVLKRRKELKLSQQELAEASGMSLTIINRLEKEKQKPRMDNLRLVAKALGCLPEDLYQVEAGESVKSLAQIIANQENLLDEKEGIIRALQAQLLLNPKSEAHRVASSSAQYETLSSSSKDTRYEKLESLCQMFLTLEKDQLDSVKEYLHSVLNSKKD